MDRMSLYYFTKERQTIENRKKGFLKLISIFTANTFLNKY